MSRLPRHGLRMFSADWETGNYHGKTETDAIPSRGAMVKKLKSGRQFDVLIVGGGATGAGAALDAAQRGLKVACVEREDFGSGTSGRRYILHALPSPPLPLKH